MSPFLLSDGVLRGAQDDWVVNGEARRRNIPSRNQFSNGKKSQRCTAFNLTPRTLTKTWVRDRKTDYTNTQPSDCTTSSHEFRHFHLARKIANVFSFPAPRTWSLQASCMFKSLMETLCSLQQGGCFEVGVCGCVFQSNAGGAPHL